MTYVQYLTVFIIARKQLSVNEINGISLPSAIVKNTWTYMSTPTISFVRNAENYGRAIPANYEKIDIAGRITNVTKTLS